MQQFNYSGITTGLLGYTLRKDFLGGTLFYRETEVFNYEIYSSFPANISGNFSASTIQGNIFNEFTSKYSGDINVKVFQVPMDYTFPNDSIRVAKFNVQVEARKIPLNLSEIQSEITGSYYFGLDSNFFINYGTGLLDFKEDFVFEQEENGNQKFSHDLSFSLLSGDKSLAQTIASYIFSNDSNTTFGITAMVGGSLIANTGSFLNYFTETYDNIRNAFSFSKKREILPITASNYVYNLNHTLDLKEDGVFDISEKGSVKGNLNFGQSQLGASALLGAAYTRCNAFYSTYNNYAGGFVITYPLIDVPTKTLITYNKPGISSDYEIAFTNSPIFQSNGTTVEEIIELDVDEKNLVDIKDKFTFGINRRSPPVNDFMDMINTANNNSPINMINYYALSNFYNSSWPLQMIKRSIGWANKKSKVSATFEYSSNPKHFIILDGVLFNKMEYKVSNKKPVDVITEYRIVNRPNKLSVLNYAYQTEKGEILIDISATLGRNPNEFVSGFRTNISTYMIPLYKFGIQTFMAQFSDIIPISFTYFLSDAKYTIDSDGLFDLQLTFNYTLKKHTI